MEPLYKIFNKSSSADFEREYHLRMNFPTTVKINLLIKPMNNPKQFDLYYLPTEKIINLVSTIHVNDTLISKYISELPTIAQHKFLLENIADELQNTNEIEGVRSTREEIVRSVKNLDSKTGSKDRFSSMVQSYLNLNSSELNRIESALDIRKIYDLLLDGEIDNDDLPDGKIFRAGQCDILKKSGTQKVIHKGVLPESKIIEKISEMINFLNDDLKGSLLIRIAIAHYYFGYIHPFYDGNGRCSRFISSMYLKQQFSSFTAISLSKGCNTKKNKYLEAFDATNKITNRGELNYFIESFLEILKDSQEEVITQLKEKKYIFDGFKELLEEDEYFKDKSENVVDIFFVLGQDTLFSSDKGLTASQIANIIGISEQTSRKILRELIKMNKVDNIGSKPKLYFVNDAYFE